MTSFHMAFRTRSKVPEHAKILRLFNIPAKDDAEEKEPHARLISCEWLISNSVHDIQDTRFGVAKRECVVEERRHGVVFFCFYTQMLGVWLP